MYHYVRDLQHSRYPKIKGLTIEYFKEQIAYIKKHYNVISAPDLLDAIKLDCEIPPRALLLTFDDGYRDHFENVFPILDREKIRACFFPSAKCILENEILEVNKIHFILASAPNKKVLIDDIFDKVDEYQTAFNLLSKEDYWTKLAVAKRFDTKEVVFIKHMLQRELPEKVRANIINALFKKYVSIDERAFAEELYMNIDQLRCMYAQGMYIGSHGYAHYWLDHLEKSDQEKEVAQSLEFLSKIADGPVDEWIMCYPHGAYNDSLMSILIDHGCVVGLTTKVGIADLKCHPLLTLPRIDTNDLPHDANAEPNEWTRQSALQ
jgi:peptidoglycan/xylan/chitin deacetylase (PgdA/CDA1 family)